MKTLRKIILAAFTLCVSLNGTVSAQSYISSIFLLLDNGGPITATQTIRFSLWSDGRMETGDVSAGVINTGAPNYAGYQTEVTETPDSQGRVSIALGDLPSFPEITPTNQFLMIEYKNSGDPVTSYVVYDDLYINGTTLDRFALVENGPAIFHEVYTNDATDAETLTLDHNNTGGDLTIQFGKTLAETLKWESANTRFTFSDDLRIEGNFAAVGQAFIAADHAAADSAGFLNLGRNSSAWESLSWNTSTLRFDLSDDLNISGGLEVGGNIDMNLNQLVEARAENLSSSPTCNSGSTGRYYQNTTDGQFYICDGTSFYTIGDPHYHNGALVNNIITATVTNETTDGTTTSLFLTDDGTSGGTKLFTAVYHVSATVSDIQTDAEAPSMAGYSYNATTGELQIKFLESAGILLGGQGLEGEESGNALSIFVIGI